MFNKLLRGRIPIFWGFLIINFLVICSSTSYLFLRWKNFSEHIAYAYYNKSAEEIGKLITTDFTMGQKQASNALKAPSKVLQEQEDWNFIYKNKILFQNFLTTMLVPNNISKFGIYIPNRGHVTSWTNNIDIFNRIDLSGSNYNGTYRYQTGEGWEKINSSKSSDSEEFFYSPWMDDMQNNPGKLISSNPWINVNTGELGLRVGKYIKTPNNSQGTKSVIIYCDCFYTISTDFFDQFIDIKKNTKSHTQNPTDKETEIIQKHPILIIDKHENIYISEKQDTFFMSELNNDETKNRPIIKMMKEKFKNGEMFLPEDNDVIHHYNIPQKNYPNSMVIILKMENSKWWIAMVFAGKMIDRYNSQLSKALLWALSVMILIYLILYIAIRNLIVKPISIINSRIAGMKDLVFIKKDYNSPVMELDNINSSLNTFEASFKSFLKFVPREMLLEQLSTGKEVTTGWEEKEMSVLVCQISNFYNIATSSNEFYQQLTTFIEIFNNTVGANNGNILNPEEMRFNAVWNKMKNPQTMADKAFKSAATIKRKITDLNKTWENMGKAIFDCNFFIFTDKISIGNIGTKDKLHHHIFGEKVYQATAVMEQIWAEGIKIAIDNNTANTLTDEYICRPILIVTIKNKLQIVHEAYNTKSKNIIYPDINLFCNNFKLGWELFYQNKYEQSLDVFSELSNKYPNDIFTKKYLTLCQEKIALENKGSNKDILGIK